MSRIGSLTIADAAERQTPKESFGELLTRSVGSAVQGVAGVAGAVGAVNPVISAAASGIGRAAGVALSPTSAAIPSGQGAVTGAKGVVGQGNEWDMLEATKALATEGREFNMQYLALQEKMQKESREFNTLSNVMKVRHDAAKSAINNIH